MPKNLSLIQEEDELNEKDKTYQQSLFKQGSDSPSKEQNNLNAT